MNARSSDPSAPAAAMHYDENYFEYQRSMGEFGAWADLTKFAPYVAASDVVLDFGCGGGYLLKRLACARRVGVEPNPAAARVASANGVEVYSRTSDVPDACADVVISNHALEHTRCPLDELVALRAKLKPSGRLVIAVPSESVGVAYDSSDPNGHLYSWSPMSAGNLVSAAGYDVATSVAYRHRWPPYYRLLARALGRTGFGLACRIYARLNPRYSQVMVVAARSN